MGDKSIRGIAGVVNSKSLSSTEKVLLIYIAQSGGRYDGSITDLAKIIGKSKGLVSVYLKRLEQHGYLRRNYSRGKPGVVEATSMLQ